MGKIKIEIKHYLTGSVLFQYETEENTILSTLKEALSTGANLYGANLRGADLYGADLYGANLRGANLRGADLYGADLYGADLYGANLYGANLRGADLYGANLYGANLRGADLYGADLYGANLRGANLRGADLYGAKNSAYAVAQTVIVPEGILIGWKMARLDDGSKIIVKLRIPEEAKRSNASGRKCRAEFAEVITAYLPGKKRAVAKDTQIHSDYNSSFKYLVGDTIKPTSPFNEDRWDECSTGIHFFITREEAENY